MTSIHKRSRLPALAAALILVVAACDLLGGSAAPPTRTGTAPAPTGAATPGGSADGAYAAFVPDAALRAAAIAEGSVTTIGLGRTLCNYGEIIDTFEERTGVQVNDLLPEAGVAEQLDAIAAGGGDPDPGAPDVIDVDVASGADAQARQLLQPYMVATWDTIPASAKDAQGEWYGNYYGVVSFEVNTDVVTVIPRDWPDLLEDEYAAQVALPGDPLVSSEAMHAVHAAALANGGTPDDATKGLEFFRDLSAAGSFMPVIAKSGTVAGGETPIRLALTYNALTDRDDLEGTATVEVVVPTSGRLAGVSVQAISRFAPHPSAARLWMEFLFSDEGQNLRVGGYCHPIRYADLVGGNRIPGEQLARLPDVDGAIIPTLGQITAAEMLISSRWKEVVGADVVCSLDCE